MAVKQFTTEQMIEAITKAEGFLYPAAKLLGCSTKTVERYIAEYPTVAAARYEAKYRRDDFVESQMMKRIKEGSDTMMIFYAKTQMKHRGYIERLETANLNIDITVLNNEQLQRIAAGEDPTAVLANPTQSGG